MFTVIRRGPWPGMRARAPCRRRARWPPPASRTPARSAQVAPDGAVYYFRRQYSALALAWHPALACAPALHPHGALRGLSTAPAAGMHQAAHTRSRFKSPNPCSYLPEAAQQCALKLRRAAAEEGLVARQHAAELVLRHARAQRVRQRAQDARAVAVAVLVRLQPQAATSGAAKRAQHALQAQQGFARVLLVSGCMIRSRANRPEALCEPCMAHHRDKSQWWCGLRGTWKRK